MAARSVNTCPASDSRARLLDIMPPVISTARITRVIKNTIPIFPTEALE